MAGLLNVLQRYLPRFGTSPAWLELRRPLALVVTSLCLLVNFAFDADVEAQGGTYATGVLVLMASGAFEVMLAQLENHLQRLVFTAILGVFAYVLVVNTDERPDRLKIAALFIGAITVASVWSRWRRAPRNSPEFTPRPLCLKPSGLLDQFRDSNRHMQLTQGSGRQIIRQRT